MSELDQQQQQHEQLISYFLEIAVGQTDETARKFLQATNWNIDVAINLYLHDNNYDPSTYHDGDIAAAAARFDENATESVTSDDPESDSRLSSLYRPPLDLLFEGSFEEAKSASSRENLWLLVNLQSRTEFASHTINRDLWSNEAVSQAVESSFVLWQVYDHTNEGKKISTFYKIESAPPVVLVIDPITGQKMRMWSGVVEAQSFVEDLPRFMETGPHEHIASLTRNRRPEEKIASLTSNRLQEQIASMLRNVGHIGSSSNRDQPPAPSWGEEFEKEEETWASRNNNDHVVSPSCELEFEESVEEEEEETCLDFPDLTEEPAGDCDQSVVCSICVRFPDGRRKQRRFLKTEPFQLLWSFCYSHMEGSERRKAFNLVEAVPGASKTLDYGANMTFQQSGLANSMISVTWE